VVGVSPGNVAIHMVKVFGDTGNWIYSSDLLTGCRAAQAKGAKVISMSLGGSRSSLTEKAGMDDLYNNKGVLLHHRRELSGRLRNRRFGGGDR
jgi:serine protease